MDSKTLAKYSIFTFQNPHSQNDGLFESFPLPILRYIFKNATSEQWKKLHQTCKFLFCLYPYLIVDALDISEWCCCRGRFHGTFDNEYILQYERKQYEKLSNIWLPKKLNFNSAKIPMSTILTKIIRCEIKDLQLSKCTISEMDLQFLTKWKKVESFHLLKVTVFNSENVQLPLDQLVEYAPYANDIRIETCFTTEESSKKLSELKRIRKFKKFVVEELDGTLDHELIYEFIKKNAGINSYFSAEFFDDEENTEVFKELLKHELLKLNWGSILEDHFPIFEHDEMYDKFGIFWYQIQKSKKVNKVGCECWNGKKCSSTNLYKVMKMK
uniref:F-box domain-containing protein n=1 Tax=Panagrolaimus sp. PS1159 TaxID=55785 RepID=A0AC35GD12_9BILA